MCIGVLTCCIDAGLPDFREKRCRAVPFGFCGRGVVQTVISSTPCREMRRWTGFASGAKILDYAWNQSLVYIRKTATQMQLGVRWPFWTRHVSDRRGSRIKNEN